jgi:hypothetical protein
MVLEVVRVLTQVMHRLRWALLGVLEEILEWAVEEPLEHTPQRQLEWLAMLVKLMVVVAVALFELVLVQTAVALAHKASLLLRSFIDESTYFNDRAKTNWLSCGRSCC